MFGILVNNGIHDSRFFEFHLHINKLVQIMSMVIVTWWVDGFKHGVQVSL